MKIAGSRRQRIFTALLGLAVLGISGIALRRPVLEQIYIWRLDSEDPSTRRLAAENLGEMRGASAIKC
jgi:hypothetical protein